MEDNFKNKEPVLVTIIKEKIAESARLNAWRESAPHRVNDYPIDQDKCVHDMQPDRIDGKVVQRCTKCDLIGQTPDTPGNCRYCDSMCENCKP